MHNTHNLRAQITSFAKGHGMHSVLGNTYIPPSLTCALAPPFAFLLKMASSSHVMHKNDALKHLPTCKPLPGCHGGKGNEEGKQNGN